MNGTSTTATPTTATSAAAGTTGRRLQESPAVWRPSDFSSADDWTVTLDEGERAEIVAATRMAIEAGATVTSLRRDQFPLPRLADRIAEWSGELADGRGFLLLRRFPIDLLGPVETELAYIGLGLHLGTPIGQNKAGDVLTHILDERLPEGSPGVRLYRTNKRQDFHTDAADIIGLLCLHRAHRGGESRIVSSAELYNEILRRRPDLLEVLYQPMYWDRPEGQQPGEQPYFVLAPFSDLDGTPRVFFIGWYIRDAQRHPDVPRLTADQLEALELVEAIANDPTFHVEMDFQPGDVQLLNNARILHAREAYEDDDDPDQRRHLLRLWLAAHRFASVEDGLRGGIAAPR